MRRGRARRALALVEREFGECPGEGVDIFAMPGEEAGGSAKAAAEVGKIVLQLRLGFGADEAQLVLSKRVS